VPAGDRCALFVLWPTASSDSGTFSVATYPVLFAGSATSLLTKRTKVEVERKRNLFFEYQKVNRHAKCFSKQWFETEYHKEIPRETVDFYVRFISWRVQIALDACAGVRPREGYTVINAFETAVEEIIDKFQLRPKVQELQTKFIVIHADFPFTPLKENTGARARYYADLEETRALKTQGANFQKA